MKRLITALIALIITMTVLTTGAGANLVAW